MVCPEPWVNMQRLGSRLPLSLALLIWEDGAEGAASWPVDSLTGSHTASELEACQCGRTVKRTKRIWLLPELWDGLVLFWGRFLDSHHSQAECTRGSQGRCSTRHRPGTTPPLASPPCGHHISPPDSHPLYRLASWSSGTAAHMGSNSFFLCERDGLGPWLRSTCHFPGGSGFPSDELGQTASSPLSTLLDRTNHLSGLAGPSSIFPLAKPLPNSTKVPLP